MYKTQFSKDTEQELVETLNSYSKLYIFDLPNTMPLKMVEEAAKNAV